MNYPTVGVESFGIYIPQQYVEIEELAIARNINPDKLTKGLGLQKMSIPNAVETTQFMAKEAINDLIQNHKSNWDWAEIDRIYLGTESSIDFAKPTITFIQNELENQFDTSLEHVDFLDMTFACIGAVDALHICLDYVRLRPNKKCLVIASDIAKYDLNSGGEYTQGGGAVALLVSSENLKVTFDTVIGTSTQSAFDFYKPIQTYKKQEIAKELLMSNGVERIEQYPKTSEKTDTNLEGLIEKFWDLPEETISIHRKAPVYDGKYSNECYINRIESALKKYLASSNVDISSIDSWIFHLPYAFQGRRSAIKMWLDYFVANDSILQTQIGDLWENKPDEKDHKTYNTWLKSISKSQAYLDFVTKQIAPSEKMSSEIGNMYTASIFMAMLSAIAYSPETPRNLLFLAYGSGSKSKVFTGETTKDLNTEEIKNQLNNCIKQRITITVEEYEMQHSL